MNISIIVAAGDNDVIGNSMQVALPWHQATDLARFHELTKGHPIIMGRKTYETIGKPLSQRQNIVVTHREDYKAKGCDVVHSLAEAIDTAVDDPEIFVIGGGEIYEQALPMAHKIYLTRIHARPDGDVYFRYDPTEWVETDIERHSADVQNQFDYDFVTLARN